MFVAPGEVVVFFDKALWTFFYFIYTNDIRGCGMSKEKRKSKEMFKVFEWVFDEAEAFIFKVNVCASSIVYCLVAGLFCFYGMRFLIHMVGLVSR